MTSCMRSTAQEEEAGMPTLSGRQVCIQVEESRQDSRPLMGVGRPSPLRGCRARPPSMRDRSSTNWAQITTLGTFVGGSYSSSLSACTATSLVRLRCLWCFCTSFGGRRRHGLCSRRGRASLGADARLGGFRIKRSRGGGLQHITSRSLSRRGRRRGSVKLSRRAGKVRKDVRQA